MVLRPCPRALAVTIPPSYLSLTSPVFPARHAFLSPTQEISHTRASCISCTRASAPRARIIEDMNTLSLALLFLASSLHAATPAAPPKVRHCPHVGDQKHLQDPHLLRPESIDENPDDPMAWHPHPTYDLSPALPVRWSEGYMQVPWMGAPVSCLQRALTRVPLDCRRPPMEWAYDETGTGGVTCGRAGGWSWSIIIVPETLAGPGDCLSDGVAVRIVAEPVDLKPNAPSPRR